MATYTAGDVVWGPDAYHDDDPTLKLGGSRPWLIISNSSYPGHGTQYLCCAMTTGAGEGSAFVKVPADKWSAGKPKKESHIDTETVVTMKAHWIVRKVGTIHYDLRQSARKKVSSYIS
jgi:mRNA-degrading endonuclease toxin of MazEF toxin-antitoxin module